MTLGLLAFIILFALALIGAIGLVVSRNPVYSVLFLVLNFFSIAGLYLTLHAEFLAVIQIIVYAGAIMVLFLFVIMLLNLNTQTMDTIRWDWRAGASVILGLAFLGELLYIFSITSKSFTPPSPESSFAMGRVETIGQVLYTDFLFPFEMISVVLLAALMGALMIAKKHKHAPAKEVVANPANQPATDVSTPQA